jgi:hypothetical protein
MVLLVASKAKVRCGGIIASAIASTAIKTAARVP